MRKTLKMYLANYSNYKKALKNGEDSMFFIYNKEKHRNIFGEKLKLFYIVVEELKNSIEDKDIFFIFDKFYIQGKSDTYVKNSVNISGSSYYVKKNEILNKLICLCSAEGLITKEQILNDQIH